MTGFTTPFWALLVEYLDNTGNVPGEQGKRNERVDYKAVLSPEDFAMFSRLREARKKLAAEKGLPVYAVFTNEQLAEIAKKRPRTEADLKKIDSVGESRCAGFGAAVLAILTETNPNASDREPF